MEPIMPLTSTDDRISIPPLDLWTPEAISEAIARETIFLVDDCHDRPAILTAVDPETRKATFEAAGVDGGRSWLGLPMSAVLYAAGDLPDLTETIELASDQIIARLNDRFRALAPAISAELPGRFVTTQGVAAMGEAAIHRLMGLLRTGDAWDDAETRAQGTLDLDGTRVWWWIDLYDTAYAQGSDTPTDPTCTRRVLTLLLPDEY